MKDLIKISEHNGKQVVSARDLYDYLAINERFSRWFERMCTYGLIENVDYTPYKNVHPLNNQEILDFALTLDCAKEISMLQRNEKGKQARLYFIEIEKRAKQLISSPNFDDPNVVLKLASNWAEEKKKRIAAEQQKEIFQKRVELQHEVIQLNAPKVQYFDEVMLSESTYNANQIAKELGTSATTLNKVLHNMNIQYKQNGTWLLYQKHQDKGYTKTKTFQYENSNGQKMTSMQTVWTEKGRLFIHSLFKSKSNVRNN